jgi:hypothetical protein
VHIADEVEALRTGNLAGGYELLLSVAERRVRGEVTRGVLNV